MRRAKIIATIGPASSSPEQLYHLITQGVDVFRLNFSHSTFEEHSKIIHTLRTEAQRAKRHPALMQDLPGAKARITNLQKPLPLSRNTTITIALNKANALEHSLQLSNPSLLRSVNTGDPVLIDDGLIKLRVIRKTTSSLQCRVEVGGIIKPHKGVNAPTSSWVTSTLTPSDKKALLFGMAQDIDYIALSFIADARTIYAARKILNSHNSHAKIIAKIERPIALNHLEDIVTAADGVMVARGDLAIEASPEKVPFIQKEIIRCSHSHLKQAIVATQMLESMTEHLQPTRAEVSDVANAILEGADALMLSAETAVGNYPVETVRMMDRIIREAELRAASSPPPLGELPARDVSLRAIVTRAAVVSAVDPVQHAIVVFTNTGATARLVSALKPRTLVYAFTPSPSVLRQLQLEWGITPFFMEHKKRTEDMLESALGHLQRSRLIKPGMLVFSVAGGDVQSRFGHTLMVRQV